MKFLLNICKMIFTVILLFPFVVLAQVNSTCSLKGYTIATINGVFTGGKEAIANKKALDYFLSDTHRGETLTIDYLLNPSHIWGLGDSIMVVYQKFFEKETVTDYDLVEMLKDASAKVKTQKLLLVAHSQGNFYANSFYDTVAGQVGGLPTQSIGIYSVANPASRVADKKGKWLTSDTDHVIAGLVDHLAFFRKIMPTNIHIAEVAGGLDPFSGHSFSDVYLKYSGERIVSDIQETLDRLASDPERSEDSLCIDPPKITIVHKVAGIALTVTDAALATTADAFVASYDTYADIAVGTYHLAVATAVWSYNTTVAVAIWSYNTTTAVAKFVGNATVAVASTVYNAVVGALSGTAVAGNNSAAVILATQSVQNLPSVSVDNNKTSIVSFVPVANDQPVPIVPPQLQPQPQTVFVFEPTVLGYTSAPKVVFVGSFWGGGGAPPVAAPQVLGTQSTAPVIDEVVLVGGGGVGAALVAPALSVPQCAQTLATDGCLLATTTVRFEWAAVSGASYYATIKNGAYATTTETALDIVVRDFSDYTLEVVAVGTDGTASATGTQAVSVATIPIAINEIAWMGTRANTSDEWFEIKNNTGHTIDLSQWELNAKDNTPYVKLTGTIAPHAYLIFERTDNTAVKDVDGEVYGNGGPQWALGNSGEQLNLSHASTTFDQTPDVASSTWAGGSNNSSTTRKTMERYSSRESGTDPANWGTNLGYIKNGTDAGGNAIGGTPGAQNSVSTLVNKGEDITSDFTLTDAEERYVVPRTILVATSSTLTVEPGVDIKFYSGGIHVEGQLVVSGTPENPVFINMFNGNSAGTISVGGGWVDGVYVGTDASATINNANIENIDDIFAYDNARLEISNTDFSGSSDGIFALDRAQISIASSTIRDTYDNHAVAAYENSQVTIASSTIINTLKNAAVGVYENAVMTIASTTIDGVPNGSGIVVYDGTLSIASSTIKNVDDSGIYADHATSTISNTVIENAGWMGIEIYRGSSTIASTTISDVSGWAGVSVDEGILSISSSTIKNVSDFGIATYKATTTISNSVIENGGWNGIDIYKGATTVTGTTVSCFGGSGISVTDPTEPVVITGGEVTGNAIGIDMEAGSAIITPIASVHDNGALDENGIWVEQDIVVW